MDIKKPDETTNTIYTKVPMLVQYTLFSFCQFESVRLMTSQILWNNDKTYFLTGKEHHTLVAHKE